MAVLGGSGWGVGMRAGGVSEVGVRRTCIFLVDCGLSFHYIKIHSKN